MKTITMLVATAALVTGIAAANAQVQRSKWTSRRAAIAELLNEIPMEPQAALRQIRRRPPQVQRVHRGCQRRKTAPGHQSRHRLPAM